MKTSLFDMTFTLPPMLEITEVEKDIHLASWNKNFTQNWGCC